MKKILIISPKFPYPTTGACEQDRASGVEIFLRLGFKVCLISKLHGGAEVAQAAQVVAKRLGCEIITVPYKFLNLPWWKKLRLSLSRLVRPWYLDGAAFEYSEPEINHVVKKTIDDFKPDIVWFDYTYLWPLYKHAQKKKIPIITRSVNFEPRHFLEEDGVSFLNLLLYIPKLISEFLTIRKSDCLAVLNSEEAKIYTWLGAKKISILPLRGLPPLIGKSSIVKNSAPLQVLYMSSTYRVAHNRRALEFLLKEIVPQAQALCPGSFIFRVSGSKLPLDLANLMDGERVKYEGYVSADKWDAFLSEIDLVVSPSSKKVGMQQKVFEPLVRGIPLITSSRNMVGYPFYDRLSVLFALTSNDYAKALKDALNAGLRSKLSRNAVAISSALFSKEMIESVVQSIVDSVIKTA